MPVTLCCNSLLRRIMRATSPGSCCAKGASASCSSECRSAIWVCFSLSASPLYSSAPTTCESRTAAVATLAVSRARFMLPVMSSSVCCCTCSWIWLACRKPSTATPLTISVTATTNRLKISRRPRALAKNGERDGMGLGSSANGCPHPGPLPQAEGKEKCDGD